MDLSLYKKKILTLVGIAFIFFPILGYALTPQDKVSLQLNWKFQFEFAGFIMAKEKGFYQEAGLDVELIEYQKDRKIVEAVLSGQHNYGLYNSSIAINEGEFLPTILMASYLQRSPLVFITSKGIKSPKDLIGKKIMGTKDELKNSTLGLLLNHFYIHSGNTSFRNHSFSIDDFISGKVDAITAFRTNEVFELNNRNAEYNIIDPADYGFSMSAVNLFTSSQEALNYPERTRRFIQASNKGWAYAITHVEESIAVIHKKYSNLKSTESLEFEANTIKEMMLLGFFEIGEPSKELALRMSKQLHYSGLIATNNKLGTFEFEELVNTFNSKQIFSKSQLQYLHSKKEITMCVDPDWMPFESIKNGQHIGITADIIELFKKQLPIPINLIKTENWQASLLKAKQRKCDILSLAAVTPSRSEYMGFTTPYLDLPVVMATKSNTAFINKITDIKNQKLGIVKDYAMAEILRKKIPDINIVDVDSITDGLERVGSGELFGYIDNLMVISNSIQKDFTGELKVSSRLDENLRLSIATRNDEAELRQVFDVLVNNISEGQLQTIFNKWVAVKHDSPFDYRTLYILILALTLVSLAYVLHLINLKRSNKQLLELSITDKLTGLYNRAKIDEVLLQKKIEVDRYEVDISIIIIDIDHFKQINDKHGHLVGDSVLIEFSQILKYNLRSTDFTGRWGGEEFIIICPNINSEEASKLSKKLLQKIQKHIFPDTGLLTASAGVSQLTKEISIHRALKNADIALYKSKENGRNQSTEYQEKEQLSIDL